MCENLCLFHKFLLCFCFLSKSAREKQSKKEVFSCKLLHPEKLFILFSVFGSTTSHFKFLFHCFSSRFIIFAQWNNKKKQSKTKNRNGKTCAASHLYLIYNTLFFLIFGSLLERSGKTKKQYWAKFSAEKHRNQNNSMERNSRNLVVE